MMEVLRKCFRCQDSKRNTQIKIDNVETLQEYYIRLRSLRIIYFTMFLMSMGFSIILTGIWPYLNKLDPSAGKEFMGLVVAANPLGQMLFSPLFGWWSNRMNSIRIPLICSLILFAISNAMYSMMELRPANVKYWLLGSRLLIGISSANTAVCRSYLSAATRLNERTKAISMISLAQVLGFIIGPGLQAAVTLLGSQGYNFLWDLIVINMYTTCGWINVGMSIANIILFLPAVFQERKVSAREIMLMKGCSSERETWKSIKPSYLSAWTLIVAFFVLVFNFVLLETLGTSLTMDQFAWSNDEAIYYMGIVMSVGAVIALVTFLAITPLCKYFAEHYVMIWGGFALMVLGRALFIPWGSKLPKLAEVYNVTIPLTGNSTIDLKPDDDIYLGCPKTQEWCATIPALELSQFLLGYGFTSIAYPIGVTLIQTIFSKILGPRPQGVWMGLMTGAGCLSRVLGPVFVGSIYTRLGTIWTFGFTTLMMLISMIWLILSRKHLIPPSYDCSPTVELDSLSKIPATPPGPEVNNVNNSNSKSADNNVEMTANCDDNVSLSPQNKSPTIVSSKPNN